MAQDVISRQRIVGQRVQEVLQSPWVTNAKSGITVCRTLVRLGNGVLFELAGAHPDDLTEVRVPADVPDLLPAQFLASSGDPRGEVVMDLVVCHFWPTLGVLLSSRRFLYQDVCGEHVGTVVLADDPRQDPGMYLSLWSRHDLAEHWDSP